MQEDNNLTDDPMTYTAIGHVIRILVPNVNTIIFTGRGPMNSAFMRTFISLRRLERLEFLGMRGSDWEDVFPTLGRMTELRELRVRTWGRVDRIDVSALQGCRSLRDLCVDCPIVNLREVLNVCPIDHLEVASMGELCVLNVKSTSITSIRCYELCMTDDMSSVLQRFPSLRSITIRNLAIPTMPIFHIEQRERIISEFCRDISDYPIIPLNGNLILIGRGFFTHPIHLLRALENSTLANCTRELNIKNVIMKDYVEDSKFIGTIFSSSRIMLHLSQTSDIIEISA